MEEILRKRELVKKYEEAMTKLDGLDPETKKIVLDSLKRTIYDFNLEIKMIENNLSYMDDFTPRK